MERIAKHAPLLVGALAGCTMAAATLGLEGLRLGRVVFLLIPGFILAIAVSGNVHAFPLSVAAIGNFVFWLLLVWLVGSLIAKFGRRRTISDDPDSTRVAG